MRTQASLSFASHRRVDLYREFITVQYGSTAKRSGENRPDNTAGWYCTDSSLQYNTVVQLRGQGRIDRTTLQDGIVQTVHYSTLQYGSTAKRSGENTPDNTAGWYCTDSSLQYSTVVQ